MARQFGFQFPLPDPVKYADLQMLKVEKELLKQDFSDWEVLHGVEDPPLDDLCLNHLTPAQAHALFMERFYELAASRPLCRTAHRLNQCRPVARPRHPLADRHATPPCTHCTLGS